MARQIDDIVSFDPAESYEFTNNEVDANCYRRLIRPDVNDAQQDRGRSRREMDGQSRRPDLQVLKRDANSATMD